MGIFGILLLYMAQKVSQKAKLGGEKLVVQTFPFLHILHGVGHS